MNRWGAEVASKVRWDWYEGTLFSASSPAAIVDVLGKAFDLSDVLPGMGRHGYLRGCVLSRGETKLCEVWWGGNPGVHVQGTGISSPEVAEVVTSLGRAWRAEWSVSRCDAALDWIEAGLFDELAGRAIEFAKQRGLVIDTRGDWARGRARTLYVGSETSRVRLCLYEKGYEADGDRNWVRFEVRVRPKGRAKVEVGSWAPATALAASAWLCDLVEDLGLGARIAQSVGTVWRPSDAERARRSMLKQYGRVMLGWFEDVGSWERVGIELGASLALVETERSESLGDSCGDASALRWSSGALARVSVSGGGPRSEVYTEAELVHQAEVHSADDEA